jgi:hypothetical protein
VKEERFRAIFDKSCKQEFIDIAKRKQSIDDEKESIKNLIGDQQEEERLVQNMIDSDLQGNY